MNRAARAAALLCLAAALGTVRAAAADERSRVQRFLEEKLSAAVRGEVRFGSLEVSVTGLEAKFTNARLTIPAGDAPPLTLAAGSGSVRLAWSSLAAMAAGRIRIEDLVLEAPDVAIDARWVEAFARRPKGTSPVQVELMRVRVAGARLSYRDASQGLDVRLEEAAFDGAWDAYRRVLVGPARARGSVVRPPIVRALPFEADGTLRWAQRGIDLERFRVAAVGVTGSLDGVVRLAGATSFTAEAEIEGPISGLQAYLGDFPQIGGAAHATLRIDKGGPDFLVLGQVRVDGGRLGPIAASSATARITVTGAGLQLSDLRARAFGGDVRGFVDIRFGAPLRFRTDLAGTALDARAILDLARLPFPVTASADGSFVVEGEPARPETWNGTAAFVASAVAGRGIPVAGNGTVRFEQGHVRIDRAPLQLAGARLAVDVDAALGEGAEASRVRLAGRTTDAALTQRGTIEILRSLGVDAPEIVRLPLSGTGTLDATIVTGDAASFDLAFDLTEGAWDGQHFDRASVDLGFAGSRVEIRSLAVRDADATLDAAARLRVDPAFAVETLKLSGRGLPLARLLRRVGAEVDADGLADAELDLGSEGGTLSGGGRIALRDGVVYGESVDEARADLRVTGDRWSFSDGIARGPALEGAFDLEVDVARGTGEGALTSGLARLDRLALVGASGIEAAGDLLLDGTFRWSPEGPEGRLATHGRDVRISKSGFTLAQRAPGDLDGALTIDGTGVHVSLGDLVGGRWGATATLGFADDLPIEAQLLVRDGVFVVGASDLPGTVTLSASARVWGPLKRPAELAVEGSAEKFSVQIGARIVQAEAPIALRLSEGRFAVGPARLRGEASRFEAALALGVESGDLDGRLEGGVDLAVLAALFRDVRASGTALVALDIGGTVDTPLLDGRVDIDGARLRVIGFPQPIEDLRSIVTFEGQTLRVDGVSAQVGGGQVVAQGQWRLVGEEAGRYEFTLDATRVTLSYPEGFRAVYDADLKLSGDADRGKLSGRVEIVQGLYDRDFDAAAVLTEPVRAVSAADEGMLPANVAIDVDLVADGNVWMRNNLGRLEARAAIDLGGSLARPEITGRVELLEGGELRFRGVDYDVDSGIVDLVDRQRIRPRLDFRARTRVKEYEIELHFEGEIDKLRYELTSYPALSEQDIIALLVTGQTVDSLVSGGSSASASTDVAASYFAGFLTGRFSRPIEKALGLEQLQITPLVTPGQADPTARVTAAKQIGRRLRFAYSVEIGTTDSEIYQLEWDMTRRFRFLAESSEEVGVGGDVAYTTRFGGGGKGPETANAASRSPEARAAAVAIEGLEAERSAEILRKLPVREGEPFTRGDLYQGAETIRRALVETSYLEARVEPSRGTLDAPAAEGPKELPLQRVTYAVERGPLVDVRIEASSWRERRRLSSRLDKFWLDSLFSLDLYEEGADVLRRDLRQRGYFAADVETVHRSVDDGTTELRYLVDRGPEVRVAEVRLEGVRAISMDLARSVVLTRPRSLLQGGRLDPEVLAEDVRALRTLYRREGYLAARISEPSVSLGLDGKRATVTVRIEEGERHRVGRVEVPESLAIPAATLREWAKLTPGDVFSGPALALGELALRDRLDRAGYPDAVVDASYAIHDAVADVTFRIEPGGFKRITEIVVEGATRTKPKILRREFDFTEGDALSRESLLITQQRLYRLGIFRTVRLDYLPSPGDDPAAQQVRVRVQEAAPLTFSLGPGWTSEEGARATFALIHANVGGYDRIAGLQGRWSSIEKRVQVFASEPRLFGRPIEAITSASWENTEIAGFLVDRRSVAARFRRKLDRRWTRLIRYTFQKVDVEPGEDADPLELLDQKLTNLRLGDVGLAYTRDTRDDPFLPTRGGVAAAELRIFAPPLASDESFAKLFLQGSLTRGWRERCSFAGAIRVGLAKTWGSTTFVPLSERYFAGGDSTIRGFPSEGLGVQLEGVALGGEALLLLNQEMRVRIWRALKLVGFVDVGNLYLQLADFDLGDLRETAGLGIRYETAIGPLRAEYAWKLDRLPEESPGEFYLAIGAVF